MADISQILINGKTYSVKDAQARSDFEALVGNGDEYIIDCGSAAAYIDPELYIAH